MLKKSRSALLVLTTQQAIIIELKLQPHRHDREVALSCQAANNG